MNEESLFAAALEKASATERRAFLDEACAGDPALRRRVERLLAADGHADGILDCGQNAAAVLGAYQPGTLPAASPWPAAVDPKPPAVPGYEVLGELGRGGMGVVYLARQLGLGRLAAVKVILSGAHSGGQDLARFRQEAEALGRLNHPNIVRVYEVGEAGGLPFFSMEFCPQGGLDKKLGGSPLPPAEAAGLVATLARRRTPPTPPASSTGTSSPPTSCWPRTARPGSPTSAWPSASRRAAA
jgi:hypothetical protein